MSIRNLIAVTLIRPIRRLDRTLSKPQPAWRIILLGAGIFTLLGAIAYVYPLAGIWIAGTIVGLLYIGGAGVPDERSGAVCAGGVGALCCVAPEQLG
jgi:drug/metabolite transporter (DMT)-like permease